MKSCRIILLFVFIYSLSVTLPARTISPLQYGLKTATNGIERYEALLRCHQDAIKNGCRISYRGIDTLKIEIPRAFTPIPLAGMVDFSGVVIVVENKQRDCYLFILKEELAAIVIHGEEVDSGVFKKPNALNDGTYLLVLEDTEPWCKRTGYGTFVTRKDVIVVNNGKTKNGPIMGYGAPANRLIGKYRSVENSKKSIKNLNVIRSTSSTYKTYCFRIENQYRIELSNISITTPNDAELSGDAAIHIENCADVSLNNITINGTYSKMKKYGYGLSLVNIYGLKANKIYARCSWGVFGTQSLNNVVLTNSDINRFDIHCYGRDVKAVNCKFSGLYNQFSSVYGEALFENCTFEDEIPVLIESSYNAYTPFNLKFKNCTFHLNTKKNYLMTLFGVPEAINERPELSRKCLPNISVKNCKVVLDNDVRKWYLIHTGGLKYKGNFDYISHIILQNVRVTGNKNAEFVLSTEELKLTNRLNKRINIRTK